MGLRSSSDVGAKTRRQLTDPKEKRPTILTYGVDENSIAFQVEQPLGYPYLFGGSLLCCLRRTSDLYVLMSS